MSNDDQYDPQSNEEHFEHLGDLPDGVGCTEIWDHLSNCREQPTE